MKKGISPLIASVILIVITLIAAGALSYWATKISRWNAIEENGCTNAGFRLYSGKYDASAQTFFIVLENTKKTPLKDLIVYLSYPEGRIDKKSLGGTLEGNTLKSFNIINVEDGFKSGVIKTNCPDVSVDFTYAGVSS